MKVIYQKLRYCKNFDHAIKVLKQNGFTKIANGSTRHAYTNGSIVIKVQNLHGQYPFTGNQQEYDHYLKFKNTKYSQLIVPIIKFKICNKFSYIVMPKGETVKHTTEFTIGKVCIFHLDNKKYQQEYDALYKVFDDALPHNTVILNGKLRVCDYQFGLSKFN